MAKYDDASWHYEGNYPENLPTANAATHIGMFLAWCITNDLISTEQLDDYGSDIEEVKARRMTGAEYLISICDEKLYEEDLNELGNNSENEAYSVKDNWGNYDLLRPIIDQRFKEWQEFLLKK